jgi:hypothetical protein
MDNIYYQPTNLGVYTYQSPTLRRSFWRRQFDDVMTTKQLCFDVAFGLIIPVLCFVCDPGIFRGWIIRGGLYGRFQFFVYAASLIELTTLACRLFIVERFPAWSRPAGGVMLAGALFSFSLGVAILPLSVLGLALAGLGALGLIPFVTAVVYLRNGLRALRLNRTNAPVRGAALVAFAFGLVVALGVPAAAHFVARRALNYVFASAAHGGRCGGPQRCLVASSTDARRALEG